MSCQKCHFCFYESLSCHITPPMTKKSVQPPIKLDQITCVFGWFRISLKNNLKDFSLAIQLMTKVITDHICRFVLVNRIEFSKKMKTYCVDLVLTAISHTLSSHFKEADKVNE